MTCPAGQTEEEPILEQEALAPALTGKDGEVSRINCRPPEQLKQRIEAAALVGDRRIRRGRKDGHCTGWVG